MAAPTLVPVSLRECNEFVAAHHRHNPPVRGWKFGVGLEVDGALVGVAIAGRPVSRHLDDGVTLEVTRSCTNGTPNANSRLYGAIRRAAKALGYQRLVTYTLVSEPGTSLKAAGWQQSGVTAGQSWSRPGRPRDDKHTIADRIRWDAEI